MLSIKTLVFFFFPLLGHVMLFYELFLYLIQKLDCDQLVQMMSMGCGMVPMMFPGIQQYMPPMGMGIGMGMGMGMEMGMNRPIMPFPNVLTGSALPTPASAAHLGPRFPMPAFHMPPVPTTEQSRAQATSQSDHMFQSFAAQNPNPSRIPNFSDPYQQYLGSHQMQLPVLQQVTF